MTTNMNFGPEWMRGSFPKHNNTSTANTNSNTNFASGEDLLPFEENASSQQQQQAENPFKYSKDFMLSLFKPDFQLPFDFKQHEYVTTEERTIPLAFEELTEAEKKLLSGPVHSEVSQRKGNRHHRGPNHNNNNDFSPMQSPANENGHNNGRLGQRKGRTGDYFANKDQQSFKRGVGANESDLLKRRDQGSDELNLSSLKLDDESASGGKGDPSWAASGSKLGGAFTAGSAGLFDQDPFSKSDMLFGDNSGLSLSAPPTKNPEETKWFYRDPSGQVQGPFDAQEMQDWYKAGFFTPTLMLRREDESVFEPLMVLTQKVGNEDQPFLAPRPPRTTVPTPGAVDHLFGGSGSGGADSLFRNDTQQSQKYMPFGGAPTTPGGSLLMDGFLNNNPTTPLYQNPYNTYGGGNSLLRDNRWGVDQPQASPSWLNPNNPAALTGDLFSGGVPSSPLSPFMPQQQQQQQQNLFGGVSSPGLFDYSQRNNEVDQQHQQYMNILQQNQQQRSMQFNQQFNQMQFPAATNEQQPPQTQTSPLQQQPFKNVQIETFNNASSNHASPVLRPNIINNTSAVGGWGSVPGTPVGDGPSSSPWGSIVSTAIPQKVSEELQAKAPGAQSPRAPSSPTKKAIEKPAKSSPAPVPVVAAPAPVAQPVAQPAPKIQSFADIQLEEEKMAAAKKAAAVRQQVAAAQQQQAIAQAQAAAAAAQASTITGEAVSNKAPAAVKPIVSLREIQEEELRIANEKKKQKQKVTVPSWAASNITPLHTTTTGSWSQPSHKPLSLREIQELEAKEQQQKTATAAELISQQQALANATPSTLSWGVVVPNNSKSAGGSPSVAASAVKDKDAWTAPTGPKKTLREIQQEEELAMKKKNAKAVKNGAAAIAASAAAAQSSSPARAYAVPSAQSTGGAWTTVTSTRVPKPASPSPVVAAPAAPVVTQPVTQKPVASRTVKPSGPSEEFHRWCRKALRDLNSGVNQEEIIGMLISFPVDNNAAEIIEDVIYANSLRIDGKRFAQEFMKRRKADIAGRLDIVTAGLPMDDLEESDDFKVVTTKKSKKKNNA